MANVHAHPTWRVTLVNPKSESKLVIDVVAATVDAASRIIIKHLSERPSLALYTVASIHEKG